jgi:hypothetical protein
VLQQMAESKGHLRLPVGEEDTVRNPRLYGQPRACPNALAIGWRSYRAFDVPTGTPQGLRCFVLEPLILVMNSFFFFFAETKMRFGLNPSRSCLTPRDDLTNLKGRTNHI